MPNKRIEKGDEKEIESSSPSNLAAQIVGPRVPRRPRTTNVCTARKCCACHADVSSKNVQKKPQKSSGDPNKASSKETIWTRKDASDMKLRRSSATDLSSASREKASNEVQGACRNESLQIATVSSHALRAARHRGASTAQKKGKGEQEVAPRSRVTWIRKQPAAPPNKIEAKTAAPKQVLPKKAEARASDRNKVSITVPECQASPGSSKRSSKKIHSSLSPSPSKFKMLEALTKTPKKEPKRRSSQGKQVSREKAEPKVSTGKEKLSTDTHSSTSDSDQSSDTYCEHHITWDGVVDYRVGQSCSLCEDDLGAASWIDPETEFSKLPVVSFLPCGHVFHHHCLDILDYTEQKGYPPCVLCASLRR